MINLLGASLIRGAVFGRVIAAGGVLSLALSLTCVSLAAYHGKKDKQVGAEESEVKNFGKVNDHIYRGGQPHDDEYAELARIGIKTVIDLREDPEKYARRSAEGAGLRYINVRLNAKRPPTEVESDNFLQL